MPMAGAATPTTPTGGGAGVVGGIAATGGSGGATPSAPNISTPTAAGAAAAAGASNKNWELSDYELHRAPQTMITDGSEIAVSPRALHSELMCPICLDMLSETMTTKECLHRFCAECIITALRSGNKECPTCRKKLVSKRSLRRDPNFDMLISKIYPSRDEYEAQQQKAMARLSKSHNQLALATSIEEGLKAQQTQNQNRKIAKALKLGAQASGNGEVDGTNGTPPAENVLGTGTEGGTPAEPSEASVSHTNQSTTTPTPATSTAVAAGIVNGPESSTQLVPHKSGTSRANSTGDNSSNTSDEVTEVELVFKPHPDMLMSGPSGSTGSDFPQVSQLQTRFIKTSANASVEHLNKYLGMRLGLELEMDADREKKSHIACTTWIAPNGNFIRIPQGLTLGQICDKYWRFNKPLEVFYCVSFVKKENTVHV